MEATTSYNAKINVLWGAPPQWLHWQHSYCILCSENIAEGVGKL